MTGILVKIEPGMRAGGRASRATTFKTTLCPKDTAFNYFVVWRILCYFYDDSAIFNTVILAPAPRAWPCQPPSLSSN